MGFSKWEHRDKFWKFALLQGYDLKIHFLDVSKETCLKRVLKRNKEQRAAFEFEVSQEGFDFMESWFEKTSKKEMTYRILISE